jgi:hypothetical protein
MRTDCEHFRPVDGFFSEHGEREIVGGRNKGKEIVDEMKEGSMFENPHRMIPCLSVLPLFIVVGKLSRTTPRSKWNRSCDCYPVPTNSLFIWASDSNIELGHPIVVVRAVGCSSRLFTLCCRGRLFFFFFFFLASTPYLQSHPCCFLHFSLSTSSVCLALITSSPLSRQPSPSSSSVSHPTAPDLAVIIAFQYHHHHDGVTMTPTNSLTLYIPSPRSPHPTNL